MTPMVPGKMLNARNSLVGKSILSTDEAQTMDPLQGGSIQNIFCHIRVSFGKMAKKIVKPCSRLSTVSG